MKHTPVLLSTVLDLLNPKTGETVMDVTVGLGGHAKGFLERIGPRGKLIGLDADAENLRNATIEMRSAKNVRLIHANFRNVPSLDLPLCDILFADLGLSSPHLDDPLRGFSFRGSGPLDCRFDQSKGMTAAELLAKSPERELLTMFREYGEVPRAHAFVSAISDVRTKHPIASTQDLARIAEHVYERQAPKFLPQIFQALRIAVNDELGALQALLAHGPTLLKSGGRMGVISYHSLEDRLVKICFRKLAAISKHPLTGVPLPAPRSFFRSEVGSPAPFTLLTKKALTATLEEIENNPRARSARFRALRKFIPSSSSQP